MAQQTILNLKARFQTGKKPVQADYEAVLDSYVHKDDVAAINASLIDARINNYDEAIKAVTNGAVDTFGDVLKILRGFDTDDDVAALLEQAGGSVLWSNVQGKPTNLNVTWAEQTISVDLYYNTPYGSIESVPSVSIVRGIGLLAANKRAHIVDIFITNVPVKWLDGPSQYIVHRIRAVTIAVDPKITLPS